MLELTEEEQRSLQIVCLKCSVEKQKQTGSSFNWKKVGLSRAYYRAQRLNAKDMTPRAAAAFQFLQDNNVYYKYFLEQHNDRLESKSIMTISSYDLFISRTVSNAPYGPICIRRRTSPIQTYDAISDGVGRLHAACGIHRSLVDTQGIVERPRIRRRPRSVFFLYEKQMAQKYFNAKSSAEAGSHRRRHGA